jgi:hypothetical protein
MRLGESPCFSPGVHEIWKGKSRGKVSKRLSASLSDCFRSPTYFRAFPAANAKPNYNTPTTSKSYR